MRLPVSLLIPLLASCVIDTPEPTTPTGTSTGTGTTIVTGGTLEFGDEGHIMFTRRAVGPDLPPTSELFGLFVDDARGTFNLSRCAVTGEMCLETVPPDEDDYIEIFGGTDFQAANYEYRYVGTSFRLNDKQSWYVGTEGINYYYADLTSEIGFSNVSGEHDLILDGEWGEYLGDKSLYISPMLNLLSHEPGEETRFHDGENVVIEWEPDGRGDIYLTVTGPLSLSRMYLLEDDGYFELPVDSLNLGTDPADVNFSLSRWNWGEADANGNRVTLAAVSTVDWTGEYFYVGGRDMLVSADRCLEAGAMPSLTSGLYWGRLQDWGYKDDLDVSEGNDCTNGDTDAQEGFLRVDLPGHSFVSATFQLLDEDASVYVVRDCDNPNSCLIGKDQGIEGEPESLQYFNNTDFDEEVYIGLDSPTTTNGVFYLDATVEVLGTPEMYDTCADATAMVTPTPAGGYYSDITAFSNLLDPGTGGCTASSTPGPEAMTKVEVPAGATISVNVNMAGADPAVYLLYNCTTVTSCAAGDNSSIGSTENVAYTNTSASTEVLYLVVDTATSMAPYMMTIDIQ